MRRAWWVLCVGVPVSLRPGTAVRAQEPSYAMATEPAEVDEVAADDAQGAVVPLGDPYLHLIEPGRTRFLSLSSDGSLLASTNRLGEVGVYDTHTGELLWWWGYPELLHTSLGDLMWPDPEFRERAEEFGEWHRYPDGPGWPGGYRAIFGPHGSMLAIAHNPSLPNSYTVLHSRTYPEVRIGFWLFGGYVHLFDGAGLNWRWTIETEPALFSTRRPGQRAFRGLPMVVSLAISRDGRGLATGSSAGMLRLWDGVTGNLVAEAPAEPGSGGQRIVRSLDIGEKYVATVGDSGVVRIFAVPSLELLAELRAHEDTGYWVQFSPDERHVASAAADDTMRVWDLMTERLVHTVEWDSEIRNPPLFAWGPRDETILFGATSQTGIIGLVDTTEGKTVGAWRLPLPDVNAFAVSQDGTTISAGSAGGDILLWKTPDKWSADDEAVEEPIKAAGKAEPAANLARQEEG